MSEPKYNIAKDMEGLPTGGRGYSQRYDALRAAAKSRRDLFSGSGRKNLHKLGIKEGYSFVGGEGKTLVDTIEYRGGAYNGGGDDGGDDGGGGNDNTTGPVDPIGPVTGVDGGSGTSGPSLSDLIDAISNMSAPTINIPAPPVYEPPPPPASFAAVGHAATANPGVRIRRSRSRSQGTNTLGTNFFNRGTRNTLRISGLNV